MKLDKAIARDNKYKKRKHGMREDGRSVKLLEDIKKERALRIKMERDKKEQLLEEGE